VNNIESVLASNVVSPLPGGYIPNCPMFQNEKSTRMIYRGALKSPPLIVVSKECF
jgi:hypothetical protein